MHRRKIVVSAAIAFAIAVALVAQPTSVRADRQNAEKQTPDPWVPGTSMVMSAHEANEAPPAPLR